MVNTNMSTGEVEVDVGELRVLNQALPTPLKISEQEALPSEEARLRHRAIDLRRSLMQRNLRLRSAAVAAARTCLIDRGFCEVETPTLFRSTPEGAREFLVPHAPPASFMP